MSHPRYQVVDRGGSGESNTSYVQDTADSPRRTYRNVRYTSWVDASYTAQWLNDRDKGYSRVIRFRDKDGSTIAELQQIHAELLQMQAHSHQNWRNHGALKSPKRIYK